MPIFYDEKNRVFNLIAKDSSYIIKLFKHRYPVSVYWGKKTKVLEYTDEMLTRGRAFGPTPDLNDKTYS
ncbi:MAG: hypothetical protein ACPL1I_10010, partial [bacterium]